MLTEASVSGTYQQYKQDTNHLINWLSQAAMKRGYDIKPLTRGRSQNAGTQRYTVTAQQIKVQALLVANCKNPRILVPASVLKAAKDAIESRKNVSEYYSKFSSKHDASDLGHQRFISTLETILATLQKMQQEQQAVHTPCQKENRKINSPAPGHPVSNSDQSPAVHILQNKFSNLEVEESEIDNDATGNAPRLNKQVNKKASKQDKPQPTPPNVTFEASINAEEENDFALACFLKDLTDLRCYIGQVWKDYKAEKLSLIVASTITNLAIGSVKDMEQDFFDRHTDSEIDIGFSIFRDLRVQEENYRVFKQSKATENLSSPDFEDFQDISFTLMMFKAEYQLLQRGKLSPLGRNNARSNYEPCPIYETFFRKGLCQGHKAINEQKLLSKLLMEYSGVHTFHSYGGTRGIRVISGPEDLTEDMISLGLRDLLEKDDLSIWTTFACRIYLDVVAILGENAKTPYREMLIQVDKMDLEMKTKTPSDDLRSWMGCPSCTQCGTRELRRSDYHIKILIGTHSFGGFKDLMRDALDCISDDEDYYDTEELLQVDDEPFAYYQQNMLCCGTMNLSLMLDFEMIGIDTEKRIAAIQIVAHLYHASKFLEHVEVPCIPELDAFIQRQGYLLFGTATPTTFRAAYDCFLRSLNACPGAKSRLPGDTLKSFNPSSMKSMRPNRAFNVLRQHYNGELSMRGVIANLMAQCGHHGNITEKSSQKEDSNLVSVLDIITKHLSAQLPELTRVNYWSLANKCIWVLTMIRTKLNHEFSNKYEPPSTVSSKADYGVLAIWLTMIANVLQGAGEALEGTTLKGIGLNYPGAVLPIGEGSSKGSKKSGSQRNRYHNDKGHDIKQRDRKRIANGCKTGSSLADYIRDHGLSDSNRHLLSSGGNGSCTCCGPSELKLALEVLGKVWAFKDKEDEE